MVFQVGFLNRFRRGGVGRDCGDLVYPASQLLSQSHALKNEAGAGEAAQPQGAGKQLRDISS